MWRQRSRTSALLAAALLTLAACGGGSDAATGPDGDPSGPPGSALPNGSMTARVNGAPWRASFVVQAQVLHADDGQFTTLVVTGVDTVGRSPARGRQFVITLGRRATTATTGTFPLGATNDAGRLVALANVVEGASNWATPMHFDDAVAAGTLVVTSLTAERITGTFAYTAEPAAGNPPGDQVTLEVTEGAFDIRLTPVP